MDPTDKKLLNRLRLNARESASALAQKVNLSVSAVIERIKKLEASGVIKQYTTVLDNTRTGKDVTAFINVTLEHPKYNSSFIKAVISNGAVIECDYIAGDFDFLLKVETDNTKSLEQILNDVKSITGVEKTKSIIVLSMLKNVHSAEV